MNNSQPMSTDVQLAAHYL